VVTLPVRDKESPALARREQILEAARAVIDEHGPDALTGQIADRAGLARPNVYRHFASKDELDREVARSTYRELRAEVLRRLDQSDTPLDVIRAPIEAQVIWADRHPNLYRFLVSRGYQPSFQQHKDEPHDFAAELTAAGARFFPHFADDRDAAAIIVVGLSGLVDASILAWLNRKTETRKGLIDRLTLHAWLIIDHHLRDRGARINPDKPLPRPKAEAGLTNRSRRRSSKRSESLPPPKPRRPAT
jgi:AcrR family transcriptional regulator